MITKQVNCAANKEVYEATNQPQCSFFLVSSSELLLVLPSRLLKEACLTGTLELFR